MIPPSTDPSSVLPTPTTSDAQAPWTMRE